MIELPSALMASWRRVLVIADLSHLINGESNIIPNSWLRFIPPVEQNGDRPTHRRTQLNYSRTFAFYYYVRWTTRTTLHQVFYPVRPLCLHFVTSSFPSYLSLFTNWVQGTSRRLLASITIVDYTGAIGVTFTVSFSVPSLLTPLCPVLDTFVEPTEEVVSAAIINGRHF